MLTPARILQLLLLFSSLGIVIVLYTLKKREKRRHATIKERIRPYVDQAYREELARQKSAESEEESFSFIRGIAEYLSETAISEEIEEKMRNWLLRSGLRVRPAEYVIICFFVMVVIGFLSALLGYFLFGARVAVLGLVGFALGWIFPVIYVFYRRHQRMKAFNSQLLDLINLMSNGLKSGYGFIQALQLVASEARPPASEEFERVVRENRFGIPVEDALERLVDRMESDDLDLVVTAVLIQRQVGGRLSEILDQISSTIRERVKIQGQIRALTAQGKMGGAIISLLPFLLGVVFYFLQTEMMVQFLTHPVGIAAIIFALFWQGIGFFFIWQIVNIDI